MMRMLAQFIMRGRWHAAAVALLGSWFPIVTPATVGLVTLRLGAVNGFMVVVWAILPAIVALWATDISPLMAYATIAVMFVVLLNAAYLRSSMSWAQTLLVLSATSTLAAICLSLLIPDLGDALTDSLNEVAVPPETEEAEPAPIVSQWSQAATAGILAYLVALSSLFALLVARWWQALLYNPGGFQAELHNLRLPPVVALSSAGATAYCLVSGAGYEAWANVFSLPLVMAGVGLAHYVVKAKGWGFVALTVFYVALVLVRPVVFLLAALAFVDVWLNVRNRLKSTQ